MFRRLAAAWFAVQGLAVAVWWLLVATLPSVRSLFVPPGDIDPAMAAFILPDLLLLATGSWLVTFLILRNHRLQRAITWIVIGAVVYATVYTIGWTVAVGAPWTSASLMLIAAAGSLMSARAGVGKEAR